VPPVLIRAIREIRGQISTFSVQRSMFKDLPNSFLPRLRLLCALLFKPHPIFLPAFLCPHPLPIQYPFFVLLVSFC